MITDVLLGLVGSALFIAALATSRLGPPGGRVYVKPPYDPAVHGSRPPAPRGSRPAPDTGTTPRRPLRMRR